MPWCPKCETEYREGILTCADCGSALVEDLNSKIENTSIEPTFLSSEDTAVNEMTEEEAKTFKPAVVFPDTQTNKLV